MYVSQDPIGLGGGILNLYGYVDNTNVSSDILGLADFIVTPSGVIIPTNRDINLVSTSDDGYWFQIHFEHEHAGMKPHTHYPKKHDRNITREVRETTVEDIEFVDTVLKNGTMRNRKNRKDKGGCSQ